MRLGFFEALIEQLELPQVRNYRRFAPLTSGYVLLGRFHRPYQIFRHAGFAIQRNRATVP